MALRTSEQVLEDMYEVGVRLTSAYGFFHNSDFESRPDGTYLCQPYNNPRLLEQQDLPSLEGLQLTASGQLEYDRIVQLFEARKVRNSLIRASMLMTGVMDFCATVILERQLADDKHRLRLTIRPVFPQETPFNPVEFLLSQTHRSETLVDERWQVELGTTDERRLYVEAAAADIIRGMKDMGDKSWIQDSGLGRDALVAVLEDPFSSWRRHKKYDALGPQSRSNSYQPFVP